MIHPIPKVSFGEPFDDCSPVTADFFYIEDPDPPILTNLGYIWDFGNGQSSSDRNPSGIVYTNEGTYDVSLTVINLDVPDSSCAATADSADYIEVYPIPVADFTSDPASFTTIALPEFRFTNQSTISMGSLKYEWDFDINGATTIDPLDRTSTDEHPTIDYGNDTASPCIRLRVESVDGGCTDEIIKCVTIGPDVTVFIPNAFTPNGAGPVNTNTFWVSVQGHIGFNIQLFNRWGEMIFESDTPNDPAFGWDGTYKDDLAQMDAYMYVCKVIGFDGETYEYKGTVTLIR